jgi:hypothetical protein
MKRLVDLTPEQYDKVLDDVMVFLSAYPNADNSAVEEYIYSIIRMYD